VRRAGKGKRLVIGNGAETEVNAGLVELIKEAFTIRNQFLSGPHDSIEAMSGRLSSSLAGARHHHGHHQWPKTAATHRPDIDASDAAAAGRLG
jgi:hypothetical protein